jgi:hypothetical protein
MQTLTELALERADRGIFTREQAALWAENKGPRLDALLKRAVNSGEVWRIHRGLYCLSRRYLSAKINPFELAQLIHGPSYVSMESALSHHGWTPEAVYSITSASLDRSRTFTTPLGPFSFVRVPQVVFLAGVRRISTEGGGAFFLATPLKALADLVYVQKHEWQTSIPVKESLRVADESLAGLPGELFDEVMLAYRSSRVLRFLSGLRKDINV